MAGTGAASTGGSSSGGGGAGGPISIGTATIGGPAGSQTGTIGSGASAVGPGAIAPGDTPLSQLFQMFQTLIRPAVPQVARLPTADEFLSDFNNAWDTVYQGLDVAGAGLSPEMRDWAKSEYKSALLSRYTAQLGQLAQTTGQSPFHLQEVPFSERYPGDAGAAELAAQGPGPNGQPVVISSNNNPPGTFSMDQAGPTTVFHTSGGGGGSGGAAAIGGSSPGGQVITGGMTGIVSAGSRDAMLQQQLAQEQAIQAAQLKAQQLGQGTPRDFIALPKIMPTDFLQQNVSAAQIKLEYEGSRTGAGRRYLMGGQVSAKQTGGAT